MRTENFMKIEERNRLRLDILRTMSAKPQEWTARKVLDRIRGEGSRVLENEFIGEFTRLVESGDVEVVRAFEDGAPQLFRITRKGRGRLAAESGETFDERSVEVEILRFLERPPFMQAKANVFKCVLDGGHSITEWEFEAVFAKLEKSGLVEVKFQRLGGECSKQYGLTDAGKKSLAREDGADAAKKEKSSDTARALIAARSVSEAMLLKLDALGKTASRRDICRMMKWESAGFGIRELNIMINGLERNGLLKRGCGGFSTSEAAKGYLKKRLAELSESKRRADLKTAVYFLEIRNKALCERLAALEGAK